MSGLSLDEFSALQEAVFLARETRVATCADLEAALVRRGHASEPVKEAVAFWSAEVSKKSVDEMRDIARERR